MSATARRPDAGVTLVEMLVALALFALIGVASFSMLAALTRLRDRSEGRLDAYAALDRTLTLFSRDMMQSPPRGVALEDGRLWVPRPGGGRFGYVLDAGTLVRGDGTAAGLNQHLLGGVVGLGWRFLDADGAWHQGWPDPDSPAALRAVEMDLTVASPDGGPGSVELRRLAAVTEAAGP